MTSDSNKKYVIYQNDLKFRSSRNLDDNKIDWEQNNIKHLYNVNHDTIDYRINEFKKNNSDLDLEDLNLISIPKEIYNNNLFKNIKHLFLSNNSLEGNLNISMCSILELLNIDNNKISSLEVNNTLLELSCNNNNICVFPNLPNIKRLRGSNNNISSINNINKKCEIIELDNNKITNVDLSYFTNIKRLILFRNPINNILLSPFILYADLSETNINKLDDIYNIEHLVLNTCKNLKELPKSNKLKILEIIETPIQKLYFYNNFELILLQLNITKNISSKYKEIDANMQIRKNVILVISKGIDIKLE